MTATKQSVHPAGRPLSMLVAVLGGWLILRVLLWESPFLAVLPSELSRRGQPSTVELDMGAEPPVWEARSSAAISSRGPIAPAPTPTIAQTLGPPWAGPTQLVTGAAIAAGDGGHAPVPSARADEPRVPVVPGEVYPLSRGASTAGKIIPQPAAPNRWSGDAWLLARRDSAGALVAGEPSYGRSQAGAVLRYRLAPTSGHRPVAYARATRAMAGPRETELAVGFAARPIAGVPVSIAGEVRAYDAPAGREIRPAAFAVTELPPAKLPLGLRGEAYAQAGYVGGRFATAFVDGEARVDAKLAGVGRAGELRAGAGVWGGAQKHTARLDVGPSATLDFRLGRTLSRVALDYRWRVAGDAEPESGPALTISAGF